MNSALEVAMNLYGFNKSVFSVDHYIAYMDAVLEKNKVMNLTTIVKPNEFVYKHIIDSLSILSFVPIRKEDRVLDIGTGAGFPGMPIKLYTDCHITLLDALNKRIRFITETVDSLSLMHCNAVHGRAEEMGHNKEYRETYDFVVTRAVAHLRVLTELSLPFVAVGGLFIALKGPQYKDELKESEKSIHLLGGKVKTIHRFEIPEYDINHYLVIIEKITKTEITLPRTFSLIQTKSL